MADPKDKGEGSPGPTPSTPAVPSIPRLTPQVPEPVGPLGAAAPGPGKPPLSPTPPAVPKVAPVARPPARTPSAPPPAVPPATRKTGSFPAVPSIAPVAPPVATPPVPGTRKTGSFPAVPPIAPVVARAPTPLPQAPPPLPSTVAKPAGPSGSRPPPEDEQTQLERLFRDLDQLDYFQVMGLEAATPVDEIKRAFRQLSRTYHPDRFFHSTDTELRTMVHAVYKRVTEAYFVLRDDARRKKYLADISGPDRLKKLRFDELAEAEAKAAVKKEVAEQIGTHPKGRQFFQTGLADLEAGRYSSAERNIKMALTYEPTNPLYLQKLEEARAKAYEEFKRSGKGFRIE